jgi:misacylated tRNA(Ala) deacylase
VTATRRRYLEDAYLDACAASVTAVDGTWLQLSDTVVYPGGGGQPADRASIGVAAATHEVTGMRVDVSGDVWLQVDATIDVDNEVICRIDWPYRYALMRHHALMHIVNTVANRAHQGLQTGTQLGPLRSRVDFTFPTFDRAQLPGFQAAVNEVIGRNLPISTSVITEAEFWSRPELIRTRDAEPPIEAGRVRIVEIHGFDAQACGGTHVHATGEIGTARLDGYDNKGRDNKRLYWVLE